jgi:hypothetical protein
MAGAAATATITCSPSCLSYERADRSGCKRFPRQPRLHCGASRPRERGAGEASRRLGLVSLSHPKRRRRRSARPTRPVLSARRRHRCQGGGGGGRIYLNFGDDWRSDFTISIDRKDVPAFPAAGIDVKALAGKRVWVRGWIEWRSGPMIAATHPEQLELLPDGLGIGRRKAGTSTANPRASRIEPSLHCHCPA